MRETFRMSKRFYIREKTFFGVGATADNPFKRTSRDWLGLDIADPASFGNWCSGAEAAPSNWRADSSSDPVLRPTLHVWRFCVIAAVALAGCRGRPEASSTSNGPARLRPLNVVLVTVDTLRPDHLHCYGDPNIETPALDALARRGVLFENAVAQTPLTPPSHASIFTGQNPNVHKVRNTGGFVLQSSSHPLARILQEQGWDTAAFVGSAVLKKIFGFNNGFAVYDDEMPRPGKSSEFREDPERKAVRSRRPRYRLAEWTQLR